MATTAAVNVGSQFCRDCGGPITERGGLAWCENTTTQGQQQIPQDRCENLGRQHRRFCEQCGLPVNGIQPCVSGHLASVP
jgi:hypothetical protein